MNKIDYEMNGLLLEATNNFIDEQLSVIKEQQEEIERLKEDIETRKKEIDYWRIQFSNKEEITNKAIEYIEERKNLNWYADGVFVYELLNILQGSDNYEN